MSASAVNKNFAFCPPEPGKPGPYAADGISRHRVPLPEQKGDTCDFYALQILRDEWRIGKNPPKSLADERAVERGISHYRKAVSSVDALFKPQIAYAEIFSKYAGGSCSKQQAQHLIKNEPHRIVPQYREQVSKGISSFCSQNSHKDLSEFVQESFLNARMEVHESFLSNCNMTSEFIKKTALSLFGMPWDQLSLSMRECHERILSFMQLWLSYGCQRSSWHPEQSIGKLIEQLHLHGPLLVCGQFGQSYYENPASEQPQKIEGRPILYWKKDSPRKENININHTIVIVGAKIDSHKRELVYYLDPLDGSNPNDRSTQKIYVMSYDRLYASIASLNGEHGVSPESKKPVFSEQKQGENVYALYMPKRK